MFSSFDELTSQPEITNGDVGIVKTEGRIGTLEYVYLDAEHCHKETGEWQLFGDEDSYVVKESGKSLVEDTKIVLIDHSNRKPLDAISKLRIDTTTGDALPTNIQFKLDEQCVFLNSLSNISKLNFANFSIDTYPTENGVFSWELFIKCDKAITEVTNSSATYVGEDKDDLTDKLVLKDNQPTYHVFSVRYVKIGDSSYWQMNYAYSFKA